jgi:hypothetical protein
MKIRKILVEELIRAFALGYVIFGPLSLFYRSGILSLKASFIIGGVLMAVVFVSFTLIRVRTGQELKVRGALGWSLAAASMYAFFLAIVCVGVLLGQSEIFFPHRFWSVAAWIVIPGLIAWLSYKYSEKHPPQN